MVLQHLLTLSHRDVPLRDHFREEATSLSPILSRCLKCGGSGHVDILLKPYHPSQVTQTRPTPLPKDAEDNQPIISPLAILDTKWQGFGDDKQFLVLVQWAGLLSKDTTWEPWTLLQTTYNLEDEVVLHAQGNDTAENIIKKQTVELAEAEPKEAESPNSRAKMEESRPKRTITKPPYLWDFME